MLFRSLYDGDQPWFTQKQLADMFGVSVPDVSRHIKNFIDAGEIPGSVVAEFATTASDGKTYSTNHYALDVAFYVGYRVNSAAGVLFRKWATAILVRFATKGFVVDQQALKNKPDRIAELREIIRDIRSDEANVTRSFAEFARCARTTTPSPPPRTLSTPTCKRSYIGPSFRVPVRSF